MPPEDFGKTLTDKEKDVIENGSCRQNILHLVFCSPTKVSGQDQSG